ncbi:hypothetical protein CBR_g11061 [Chara braunii]|uniref:DUF4360 domain-containing protein n=1 Tax=Chara braunii TaxID=69332 RepID=A0A388KQ48_CHABU|nr:hypothetical protein CBR_g11061 [Chara braunii]|eukprot:GBG72128.1 hypothetical protein CBR_g11061 [Chara braunii]
MESSGRMRATMSPLVMVMLLASMVAMAASSTEPARHGRSLQVPAVDLGEVVIGNASAMGTGCPNSVTTATISMNNTLLSIQTYFDVAVPTSDPIARTYCHINVQLNYTAGWAVATSYWDTYGAVNLDQGLVAVHNGDYYYMGGLTVCSTNTTINATLAAIPDQGYLMSAVCDPNATLSTCGENRDLVFRLTQRIDNRAVPAAQGYIRGVAVFARLQWQRCVAALP